MAELARRRALAALRKQIEATDLATFAAFLQRWQHLDPRDRLSGPAGLEIVLRQLRGLPRPSEGWERDYLPARLERYDPVWLSQLGASGRVVWAGGARRDAPPGSNTLAMVRFFERSEGAVWLSEEPAVQLSERAQAVRGALDRYGASFLVDLQQATGLGMIALRDALRELTAGGLVTNDTVEALREVIRMRPLPGRPPAAPDPTRWLPADFTPSPGRPIVQRRPNLRRLPHWRRPDQGGAVAGWVGRWSLLRPREGAPAGTWGTRPAEEEHAELIARQWLERYGVVTRDWWRRERPPVSWRAIYRELKRLEYRGEVRRGYFVRGLGGAQFALPAAVERLREAGRRAGGQAGGEGEGAEAPFVVMAASDPANPYSLALENVERPALSRPRGAGALLVTRAGEIAMAVEGRGRRISVASGLSAADVTRAARALAGYLDASWSAARRRRPLVVESIDGAPAVGSVHAEAFRRAGYRRETNGLRYGGPEAGSAT